MMTRKRIARAITLTTLFTGAAFLFVRALVTEQISARALFFAGAITLGFAFFLYVENPE